MIGCSRRGIWLALLMTLVLRLGAAQMPRHTGAGEKNDVMLTALQEELDRSLPELKRLGDIPPYYLGYSLVEETGRKIYAAFGSLQWRGGETTRRALFVDVRVGDYTLDNTHPMRDEFRFPYAPPVIVTSDDEPDAIKNTLWLETEKKYRQAVRQYTAVLNEQALKTPEQQHSDDFSHEEPLVHIGPKAALAVNYPYWEALARKYSALGKQYPFLLRSEVRFEVVRQTKYFVNSEGTRLRHARNFLRLGIGLMTKAVDGMELELFKPFDAASVEGLPTESTVIVEFRKMAETLGKLRQAPYIEPYTGPAILSGSAAGVFFHEIFGHRIEGHRQKDEFESQTFARQVGRPILPEFISISDDPTMARFKGQDLNGWYTHDDEGVPAQRVDVVRGGVLHDFLMSRSPFADFRRSNGHGRALTGLPPVSRQGNLIIQAEKTVPYEELRRQLVAECRRQGKPYGLVFQEVDGGVTMTGRYIPNSFNVRPSVVYRVFTDGRPDELVRGVDLIGTPLTPFGKILLAADEQEVFNGYCGAESGMVPVSALAPALLIQEIEIQKKEKSQDSLPALPPPLFDKEARRR